MKLLIGAVTSIIAVGVATTYQKYGSMPYAIVLTLLQSAVIVMILAMRISWPVQKKQLRKRWIGYILLVALLSPLALEWAKEGTRQGEIPSTTSDIARLAIVAFLSFSVKFFCRSSK